MKPTHSVRRGFETANPEREANHPADVLGGEGRWGGGEEEGEFTDPEVETDGPWG